MKRPALALIAATMALGAGFIVALAPPALAATFTPTRFDDPPPDACMLTDCSLREAVLAANQASGADTIVLQGGTYSLTIPLGMSPPGTSGGLRVTDDLTVLGDPAGTTIDGNGQQTLTSVFSVTSPASLTISQLSITDGLSMGGGGLAVGSGASLHVQDATLNQNEAGGGGALYTAGTTTLVNVTMTGNSASFGGAIFHFEGAARLNNVTINGNSADAGGGLASEFGATLVLSNTIVAGNTDMAPPKAPECSQSSGDALTSNGHNLIGNNEGCTFTPSAGDQVGTPAAPIDPLLGSLADNGGPTPTQELLPGSPAIDAGNPTPPGSGPQQEPCAAGDQRGAPRQRCDIGSYEIVFCAGRFVKIVGTPGNDILQGTGESDGIIGLGGSDRLAGKGGADSLCGGPGRDTVKGGSGKDVLKCGSGKDRCSGGPGKDRASSCEKERKVP